MILMQKKTALFNRSNTNASKRSTPPTSSNKSPQALPLRGPREKLPFPKMFWTQLFKEWKTFSGGQIAIRGIRCKMMYYLVNDTATGKRKSECSYQESNLRPSDYLFGRSSTTELQETRGS